MADRSARSVVVFSKEPDLQKELENLLGPHSHVIRHFSTRQECLAGLRAGPCNLLIIDCDGCAAEELGMLAAAMQMHLWLAALVLVERGDISKAVEAVKAGAFDCLEKPLKEEPLLMAMEQALAARQRYTHGLEVLTPTETRVLQLVLAGRTTGQIAGILHRSARTVEVHRRNILQKLNVRCTVELVKRAVAAGVLEPNGIDPSSA